MRPLKKTGTLMVSADDAKPAKMEEIEDLIFLETCGNKMFWV